MQVQSKIFLRAIGVFALALVCFMGLVACSDTSQQSISSDPVVNTADISGGVAATVNGVEIGENVVTAYIANFRAAQNLEQEDAWGEWLIDYAYTIDSIRGDTVTYYVNQELIRQAAEEQGITVTGEEVDEQLAIDRASVETDEDWNNILESLGMSEEAYRSYAEMNLLQTKLTEKIAEDTDAADDTAKQKAFSDYMNDYTNSADIVKNPLPDDAPYIIDLTPYDEAARAAAKEVQDSQETQDD